MNIADFIRPEQVIPGLRAAGKKHALQELARRLATGLGVSDKLVFDILADRERLGSTGLGAGIAIPHGKLPGLKRIAGLFARLERPIEFDAIDGVPVDLIFVLLAPEQAGADHLKALAAVSRLLRNREICAKLRGTDSPEALYGLLTEHAAPT
jgi:PTS system nitrogen regulatory IIA component